MTKTDPNTKENLQKQEKASRQSPRCKKTRKSPKSEEIQHSIAARCVPSCHDGSCLLAKKSEEINLHKIFHRSTITSAENTFYIWRKAPFTSGKSQS
ncbi:hypothetical protein QL285_044618 [Trifolium repens]|nr:hypothetical protein QL285_044618 [Trifolium repens]